MADEARIAEEVLALFRSSALGQSLSGRWASQGLPGSPVDGLPGRAQLALASEFIREIAVDAASLGRLGEAFEGTPIAFGPARDLLNDREPVLVFAAPDEIRADALLAWSERLEQAADTVDAFLETDGNGN